MFHAICRVESFQVVSPYTLKIQFNDYTEQIINFKPVLKGELYRPLQNLSLFNQVYLDPEVHTLIWPNGADFEPSLLHDWPKVEKKIIKHVNQWGSKIKVTEHPLLGISSKRKKTVVNRDERSSRGPIS